MAFEVESKVACPTVGHQEEAIDIEEMAEAC
jgi:hypothetical protein